jgi:hypothetical protein
MVRVAGLLLDSDPEASSVLQGAGDALAAGYTYAPHSIEVEQLAIAIIDATLGPARRYELYSQGAAMTDADAVASDWASQDQSSGCPITRATRTRRRMA